MAPPFDPLLGQLQIGQRVAAVENLFSGLHAVGRPASTKGLPCSHAGSTVVVEADLQVGVLTISGLADKMPRSVFVSLYNRGAAFRIRTNCKRAAQLLTARGRGRGGRRPHVHVHFKTVLYYSPGVSAWSPQSAKVAPSAASGVNASRQAPPSRPSFDSPAPPRAGWVRRAAGAAGGASSSNLKSTGLTQNLGQL